MRMRKLAPARVSSASLSSECTLKGERSRSRSHNLKIRRAARRHSRASAGGISTNRSSCVSARLILDRKSTRLNSSHVEISYAVFCLKKKKIKKDKTKG